MHSLSGSPDAALLYERGALGVTAVYVFASIAGSLAALFAGLLIVRQIAGGSP